VTQLHDVVYTVSRDIARVFKFNATTHERLADIDIKGLRHSWDIASCEQSSQVYIADNEECVWRVSADGADIKLWLPKSPSDTFKPWSLSVTSTRLLVTSQAAKQLMQFDAEGSELRRVQLPDYVRPWYSVESPRGTFIVCHDNTDLKQHLINEVDNDGKMLRQFTGSREPSLRFSLHVAADSRGNVFVADPESCRILLLDAQLKLRRVIVDEYQLNYEQPWRLYYREPTGQLFVGLYNSVAVFDVLRR